MNKKEWEAHIAWSKVAAGCVIQRHDGKYLLVQEKQQIAYGLWSIPAGYVASGETIEDAAIRETKEETGYDVALDYRVGIYHEAVGVPIRHAFAATIAGGDIVIDPDEILDIQWFSFDTVTTMKHNGALRAEWMYDAITKVETRIKR